MSFYISTLKSISGSSRKSRFFFALFFVAATGMANAQSGTQPSYPSGSQPSYPSGSQPSYPSGSQPGSPPGSQDGVNKALQQGQQTINKVQTAVAVFQPLLLKAQELYGQGKALVQGAKGALPGNGGQPSSGAQPGYPNSGSQPAYPSGGSGNQPAYPSGSQPTYPSSSSGNQTAYPTSSSGNQPAYGSGSSQSAYPSGAPGAQSSPSSYLPVSNPASVNTDGSGNWGNQNNGLYGNCLDALTGTVLGMGEAADKPASVDLLFFAPADGQNTYYIMTPGFAHDNSTATYMTQHTSDQVLQWKDVTESEVAVTKLTIGQFNQIKNNAQITGAVRNAQNYSGYYACVGQRLDGQVLAVKVQMDNRQVYALIAIDQQIGTSGGNGYLKIRIKAQGIDSNNDGQPDAANYIR
jgi:hypothetical protein